MVKSNWKTGLLILLMVLGWTKAVFAQDSVKVYADPESITGFKAAKFIDKIDFVPLETNKNSKYQNGSNFQIAGAYIVLRDNLANAVLVFDKRTGKLIYKYKNEKKKYKINSVEYVAAKNALLIVSSNKHYTISNKKALQLVKRWKGKDISKYIRLEWVYLNVPFRRKQMPAPSIALNSNITYFAGGFLYRNYTLDAYSRDSILYRLVQYDAKNQVKHKYFPYLNLRHLWADYYDYNLPLPGGSTLNDSTRLFQLDFNPTIYELKQDTLVEKYRFVFPMTNVMPADFNTLRFNNNIDAQKYKEKNANVFATYYNMIEHGDYLFFSVNTLNYQNRQFMLFNKILYDLDKIITDSSICNLPPNMFHQFFGQDQQFIYAVVQADAILKQKASLLQNSRVPEAFKKHLSAMTKDDNAIILRIKLK